MSVTEQVESTFEVASSPFLQAIVNQIRANDSYGTYRTWSDELLLKPYVVTKAQKREISIDGEVDSITKGRILAFYRAIATRVEEETGQLCQVVIDLSHEGFGWALVFCGRLLVVTRTLRDAQRFGFDSLEKAALEGEKTVQNGVNAIQKFPDAAKG
ncbi:MAG: NifX-associated nitrogen fixation protein [Leptolyngbya sp. Prado105]|jgi:probable nitrogen fixation protein|nr:NifX-associated nitrogen fixation protein [Leptolyngbya sp. Prado105]